MTKEKIIKLLDFFGIKYKKFGEKLEDAIDIYSGNSTFTISQFNDNVEVATVAETVIISPELGLDETESYGWYTYNNITSLIEKIANRKWQKENK